MKKVSLQVWQINTGACVKESLVNGGVLFDDGEHSLTSR